MYNTTVTNRDGTFSPVITFRDKTWVSSSSFKNEDIANAIAWSGMESLSALIEQVLRKAGYEETHT